MGAMGMDLLERYADDVDTLLPAAPQLELLGERFRFTEGPVWDFRTGELIFSDIPANVMYRYRPGQGVEVFRDPSRYSNGTTRDAWNRLVVCEHQTRRVVREDADGFTSLADQYQGTPLNAPNDVALAPDGSLVFTDPHYGLLEGMGGPAEQLLEYRGIYRIPPDKARSSCWSTTSRHRTGSRSTRAARACTSTTPSARTSGSSTSERMGRFEVVACWSRWQATTPACPTG